MFDLQQGQLYQPFGVDCYIYIESASVYTVSILFFNTPEDFVCYTLVKDCCYITGGEVISKVAFEMFYRDSKLLDQDNLFQA